MWPTTRAVICEWLAISGRTKLVLKIKIILYRALAEKRETMSAKSFQICKFIKILVLQRGNIFSESWRGKFN